MKQWLVMLLILLMATLITWGFFRWVGFVRSVMASWSKRRPERLRRLIESNKDLLNP
jgi:hypothetical protein